MCQAFRTHLSLMILHPRPHLCSAQGTLWTMVNYWRWTWAAQRVLPATQHLIVRRPSAWWCQRETCCSTCALWGLDMMEVQVDDCHGGLARWVCCKVCRIAVFIFTCLGILLQRGWVEPCRWLRLCLLCQSSSATQSLTSLTNKSLRSHVR